MNFEIIDNHISSVIKKKISDTTQEEKEDAFFVANLSDVVLKHKLWTEQLPRVKPFYAVKCNEDAGVLHTLAKLGTGFDCASKNEIQRVLAMKVPEGRIIYANPCKPPSHIRYAAKHKVARMTFDNEAELHKIKNLYPDAELVLRMLPPDESKSLCKFGMKYGVPLKLIPSLLKVAKDLGLNVIGISFHVGSGSCDASAFSLAVQAAHVAFAYGRQAGFEFSLLDIGGGFPGQPDAEVSFEEICEELSPALDTYFPVSCGVDIIGEPGRFYVASAFSLVVNVIAKRDVPIDAELTPDDQPAFMYYINDGVYGSFNCVLDDSAASVKPTILNGSAGDELVYTSSVWGPTCDGIDVVLESVKLPELFTGDWLLFNNMGAYTLCASCSFNGMPIPSVHRVMHHRIHDLLEKTWPSSDEDSTQPLENTYVHRYEKSALSCKRRGRLPSA